MITHRLKSVADCDWILVMDKGEIVQAGTHEELIQQVGLYQILVKSCDAVNCKLRNGSLK